MCAAKYHIHIYIYVKCENVRTLWCEEARARALGCEDVRTFEREEVRTLWCVYARKPILYIKLVRINFRTVTPLICKILMKNF